MKQITQFWSTDDELNVDCRWPLTASVIPNYMGINLSEVEGMSWTKREDSQLTQLTIHFVPSDDFVRNVESDMKAHCDFEYAK
jgi:hypothetical protein